MSTNARIFLAAFALAGVMAVAAESSTEKGSAMAHDGARKVKKMGHRIGESVCTEGDAACLAKKGKHRAQEGSDYMKDKAKQGADKVDADGTPSK